jgi:uncharacterized membrane-anchored protein
MTKSYTALFALLVSSFFSIAQVDTVFSSLPDTTKAKFDSLIFKTGKVMLKDGLAELTVPTGFKYLDSEQSSYVLTQLWGNPESETMGMLFPEYANNYYPSTWAIEFSYDDEGHVKDDDAKDIKYDELLKTMQEETKASNEARVKEGYEAVELLGWASPPFYDKAAKKLHWAKRLKFGETDEETLNYNIRVLGRKGVLVLNAIGGMDDLTAIKSNINPILAAVEFTKGN